ncbi:MAG TPA: MFS transporter, partial [Steroidobacteraceae bacterium]|nr:MFS transporter [Steroidobacteraceae bacterium]
MERGSVEVSEIVDHARFGPCALTVSVLTTLALVFDGFDIQAIAFAAPRLMSEWNMDRAALAPILAAGLLGMFVGALMLGIAGDRYGRRRALLASMALMAASSLLAATADGPAPLATYRFLTGLGLGGALPNAAALMVEFAPLAMRTVIVAITVVGVPIGGMIGAAIAARLVPAFGWPSIFVLGGVLPGALLLAMAWLLPESPQYLARRPPRAKELATTLNRLLGQARYDGSERFTNRDLAVGGKRVGPLA